MDDLITIGKITKPHGVRGEVIIRNASRWYEPFINLKTVSVFKGPGSHKLEIEMIKDLGDRIAVKFKGIDNPESAEKYREAEIKIPKNNLPTLQEREHYVFEIIGFKVYESSGELFGEVVDVLNIPANDVLIIRNLIQEEVLIPAVRPVVKEIDTEGKRVLLGTFEEFEE